jgi:Zn-dependent protease
MKKYVCLMGVLVGIVITVMGISVLIMPSATHYVSDYTFGADFYTEIYNVSRYTLKAIGEMAEIIQRGIGFMLLAIGLTDICIFGYRYAKDMDESKAKPITVKKETPEDIANELPEL